MISIKHCLSCAFHENSHLNILLYFMGIKFSFKEKAKIYYEQNAPCLKKWSKLAARVISFVYGRLIIWLDREFGSCFLGETENKVLFLFRRPCFSSTECKLLHSINVMVAYHLKTSSLFPFSSLRSFKIFTLPTRRLFPVLPWSSSMVQ